MRVAIVGSEERYWTEEQKKHVKSAIFSILYVNDLPKDRAVLVSGGCDGVDKWSEKIADDLGFSFEQRIIHKPEVKRWLDKEIEFFLKGQKMTRKLMGYMSRNILIAKDCDIGHCFEPVWYDGLDIPKKKYFPVSSQENDISPCRRSGGIFTMLKARDMGKSFKLEVIR